MTTLLLVKIFGVIFTAIGLGFLLDPKQYEKMVTDYQKNSGLTYLAGIFTTLIGILIVTFHNIWEVSLAGLMTLFGWSALIKGLIILVFPKLIFQIAEKMLKIKNCILAMGLVILVLGIYLLWQGYLL